MRRATIVVGLDRGWERARRLTINLVVEGAPECSAGE